MEKMNEIMETQEVQVVAKKKNKGFSLVELIVVIAIMAILVGIVGTQVLPYIERSRVARDQQVLSGVVTASLAAFSQNAVDLDPALTYTLTDFTDVAVAVGSVPTSVTRDLRALSGYENYADLDTAMDSNAGTTMSGITITYNATTGELSLLPTAAGAPLNVAITAR